MKKLLLLSIFLGSACTPQERALWLDWHSKDPEAAVSFLNENQPKAEAPLNEQPIRSVWDDLANCEAGGNWSINTGNGYYGGLQFSLRSWRAVGGTGYPHQHSREEQINRAELLLDIQGWGAWPACSRKLGLR